ncbi:Hypothetical predicted protein, partial [Paramuricea clavata]
STSQRGNKKYEALKTLEKSATELYQQLTTIVQSPEESPQSFLIRALDLRQKVLFASKEAGVKIKYDESLVQGLFLHSLETGLHHEAVRTKLRPFLQQPDITDELLIEQMNIIVSTETERQKKFGKASQARQRKINNVQAVKSSSADVEEPIEQDLNQVVKEKKGPKQGELISAPKTVKPELAELRETLTNQQAKDKEQETGTFFMGHWCTSVTDLKKWLDEQLPDLPIRNTESLFNDGTELDLKTANGTPMPYEGFVVVEFKLETSSTDRTIMVPMLVTHETLDYPIIGYNVIEELVKKDKVPDQIVMEWAASFPDVNCAKIQSLVSLIQAPSPEHLCFVKTIKQDVVVPRKTTVSIKCRANTGPVEKRIPVLFEPSKE